MYLTRFHKQTPRFQNRNQHPLLHITLAPCSYLSLRKWHLYLHTPPTNLAPLSFPVQLPSSISSASQLLLKSVFPFSSPELPPRSTTISHLDFSLLYSQPLKPLLGHSRYLCPISCVCLFGSTLLPPPSLCPGPRKLAWWTTSAERPARHLIQQCCSTEISQATNVGHVSF